MLSKKRRIPRSAFPSGRDGNVFHAPHLSLRFVRDQHTPSQFSVVVSKKVAKTSVARHKLKRRAYDALSRIEKGSKLPAGRYVLFAKKDAPTLSFKELEAEIKNLTNKI